MKLPRTAVKSKLHSVHDYHTTYQTKIIQPRPTFKTRPVKLLYLYQEVLCLKPLIRRCHFVVLFCFSTSDSFQKRFSYLQIMA